MQAGHIQLAQQVLGVKVEDQEIFVVTSDGSDRSEDVPLTQFLQRVRKAFDMDVVFVSHFSEGERVIREVAADIEDDLAVQPGMSHPLEQSYCHHVVTGRLPEVIPDTRAVPFAMSLAGTRSAKVGSHLATALVGSNGKAYGTICCYSHSPRLNLGHRADLQALRTIADLLSDALEPRNTGPKLNPVKTP
jgi:GAF domain-containing protein